MGDKSEEFKKSCNNCGNKKHATGVFIGCVSVKSCVSYSEWIQQRCDNCGNKQLNEKCLSCFDAGGWIPKGKSEKLPEESEQVRQMRGVFGGLLALYERKNRDYGNSFDIQLNQFADMGISPNIVFYVRANDKLQRILSLHNKPPEVVSESIIDTARDLANYSAMFVRWLEEWEGKNGAVETADS